MLSNVLEHVRVVSSTLKMFRARDAVECSNVFLSAGNNSGVIKNSTEQADPLFITFRQWPLLKFLKFRLKSRFVGVKWRHFYNEIVHPYRYRLHIWPVAQS